MAGLRKICRTLGSIAARDRDGNAVTWVWDYAADEPVTSDKMPYGSDRWKNSERAKYAAFQKLEPSR